MLNATRSCCLTGNPLNSPRLPGAITSAVNTLPLEYVDDTLGFNPEWVVDKIAPRPILFITTDNDRLVPPEESENLYARAEPKAGGLEGGMVTMKCTSSQPLAK